CFTTEEYAKKRVSSLRMTNRLVILTKLKRAQRNPKRFPSLLATLGQIVVRFITSKWPLLALAAVVLLLGLLSFFVGVIDLSIDYLFKAQAGEIDLLAISRFPRTISLIIAGIGLSVSGLIMQQMTQNKFVSPTTAGS